MRTRRRRTLPRRAAASPSPCAPRRTPAPVRRAGPRRESAVVAKLALQIRANAAHTLEHQPWTPHRAVDLDTAAISLVQALRFAAGGEVHAGHRYASPPTELAARRALRAVHRQLLSEAGLTPRRGRSAEAMLARWEQAPGRSAGVVLALVGAHTPIDGWRRSA